MSSAQIKTLKDDTGEGFTFLNFSPVCSLVGLFNEIA